MFGKIWKYGLPLVVCSVMATQLTAEEIKGNVVGEVKGALINSTVKTGSDSYSAMDMVTEATLGYEVGLKGETWSASGYADLTMDAEGFSAGNRFVKLENEALSFGLGNWDADSADIAVGKEYLDAIDQSMGIGNLAFEEAGGDYFKFGLKDTGLEFILGMNVMGSSDASGDDGLYNETLISAVYSGKFGDLALNASLTSVAETIDEIRNVGGKDCIHDGGAKSELAVGLGYAINTMNIAVNVDQYTAKIGGNPAPDDQKQMTLVLAFDMALDDDSGFTVAYNSQTLDDGSSNQTQTSGIDAGYRRTISGVDFSIGYSSSATKDDDDGTDESTSLVGAGLTFAF